MPFWIQTELLLLAQTPLQILCVHCVLMIRIQILLNIWRELRTMLVIITGVCPKWLKSPGELLGAEFAPEVLPLVFVQVLSGEVL